MLIYGVQIVTEQMMDQRVAVVTGASSGFGQESVRRLAGAGWMTIGIARREERLSLLAEEVGGDYQVCDITDPEQVAEVGASIIDKYVNINLLVNSAGKPLRKRFEEATSAEIWGVMDTNFFGTMRMTEALVPGLINATRAAQPADIVNVCSAAAGILDANSGAYGTSKGAQADYSKALTTRLRPWGINVHAVHPGRADTEGHPKRPSSSALSKLVSALTETDVDSVAEAIARMPGTPSSEVFLPGLLKYVAVANAIAPVTVTRAVNYLGHKKPEAAQA
jgi:short-subunit dehydrogenase